jgi:hypothetical protein
MQDPYYYSHRLWIREDESRNREEYITGCDPGVSFESSVNRVKGLQVTVISNTTNGAWPIVRDIDAALKGKSVRS